MRFLILLLCLAPGACTGASLPGVDDVILSSTDVWGEAAMAQPNGPSYEFFEKLLPPLRYVNAAFLHYPIVLSAPRAQQKARLVSNGSGINLLASNSPQWHEVGTPVWVRVGIRETMFGGIPDRLDGPKYLKGYLPIVKLRYTDYGTVYEEEVFASVDPQAAAVGTVYLKLSVASGPGGPVTLRVDAIPPTKMTDAAILGKDGKAVLRHDGGWTWEPAWKLLRKHLSPGKPAVVAIYSAPPASNPSVPFSMEEYNSQRSKAIRTWESILRKGAWINTPEPVVNNAWKATLLNQFVTIRGDQMCYSAQNQYDHIYVSEGREAIRSLLLWGHADEAKSLIPPLLRYVRDGLIYQQSGRKLGMVADYYWLTGDRDFLQQHRDLWMKQIDLIVNGRELDTGLLPRQRYCGDVGDLCYSMNTCGTSWRGLRDMSAVLTDMGEREEGERLQAISRDYRRAIIRAVEKSEDLSTSPPFIPNALFGFEKAYDVITDTKIGSYYNLVAPYTIASEVLGPNSRREGWMLQYIQQHGGICMGMIRCRPTSEYFVSKSNLDDLYGAGYTLTLLRRDDVDRALVSFYGKLAQGMTRDTFLSGEGTCLVPMDKYGRQMSLPPNTGGNAYYLQMLRYLLIQDWDLDDDGVPETLRLMYATPRRWAQGGTVAAVRNAPTAFGPVSVAMDSYLAAGKIIADVTAPPRAPKRMLIRARVPEGWKVISARSGEKKLSVDDTGAADITGLTGKFTVEFKVARAR